MNVTQSNSSPGIIAKLKPTSQARTGSTTLTNDSDLFFTIGVGETWVIDFILATTFTVSLGAKVAITTPASPTLVRLDAEMTSNGIVSAVASATAGATGVSVAPVAATSGTLKLRVIVTNGTTAGTVQLQIAQATSDAGATTFLAGSSMIAVRQT